TCQCASGQDGAAVGNFHIPGHFDGRHVAGNLEAINYNEIKVPKPYSSAEARLAIKSAAMSMLQPQNRRGAGIHDAVKLEWIRVGSNVACMAKEILAFLRAETGNNAADATQDARGVGLYAPMLGGLAQIRLEFAEGQLDRVEVLRSGEYFG